MCQKGGAWVEVGSKTACRWAAAVCSVKTICCIDKYKEKYCILNNLKWHGAHLVLGYYFLLNYSAVQNERSSCSVPQAFHKCRCTETRQFLSNISAGRPLQNQDPWVCSVCNCNISCSTPGKDPLSMLRYSITERSSTDKEEENTLNELNELRALESLQNKIMCHIGPQNDDVLLALLHLGHRLVIVVRNDSPNAGTDSLKVSLHKYLHVQILMTSGSYLLP